MPTEKPELITPGGEGPFKINFQMPSRASLLLFAAGLVLLVGIVFMNVCFTYIHPNEIGIKQVKIGRQKGMVEEPVGAGLAFRIPGMHVIHRFPRHVQVLDLTEKQERQPLPSHSYDHPAKIQTSDGFYVDVDVSILYRIDDPFELIESLGPGLNYLYQGILPKAEPILKDALGELTTEEFYVSPLRVAKAEKARDLLDAELSSKGLAVDEVLIRFFRYSDEIQRNIEEKKLQDQLVFKNEAEKKAAKEAAIVTRITEEGEATVKVELQKGEKYKVEKEAEKDLYVRSQRARGDLLVQLAEAKRTELKNEAMQAAGAEKKVALEMAEVLKGLDTIIVPMGGPGGMNPLDLDEMIRMFGALRAPVPLLAQPPPAVSSPAGNGASSETLEKLFDSKSGQEVQK